MSKNVQAVKKVKQSKSSGSQKFWSRTIKRSWWLFAFSGNEQEGEEKSFCWLNTTPTTLRANSFPGLFCLFAAHHYLSLLETQAAFFFINSVSECATQQIRLASSNDRRICCCCIKKCEQLDYYDFIIFTTFCDYYLSWSHFLLFQRQRQQQQLTRK